MKVFRRGMVVGAWTAVSSVTVLIRSLHDGQSVQATIIAIVSLMIGLALLWSSSDYDDGRKRRMLFAAFGAETASAISGALYCLYLTIYADDKFFSGSVTFSIIVYVVFCLFTLYDIRHD